MLRKIELFYRMYSRAAVFVAFALLAGICNAQTILGREFSSQTFFKNHFFSLFHKKAFENNLKPAVHSHYYSSPEFLVLSISYDSDFHGPSLQSSTPKKVLHYAIEEWSQMRLEKF